MKIDKDRKYKVQTFDTEGQVKSECIMTGRELFRRTYDGGAETLAELQKILTQMDNLAHSFARLAVNGNMTTELREMLRCYARLLSNISLDLLGEIS